MRGSVRRVATVFVINSTVASELTAQCETNRARAEGARQSCERLGITFVSRSRIASGKHHPIGIELQLRHFGGGEQAVVPLQLGSAGSVVWWGEHQRRLGLGLEDRLALAREQAVGGEMQDAIVRELALAG
jgi:hypothetical protein